MSDDVARAKRIIGDNGEPFAYVTAAFNMDIDLLCDLVEQDDSPQDTIIWLSLFAQSLIRHRAQDHKVRASDVLARYALHHAQEW